MQTFEILSNLELLNGNNGGIYENSSQRNDDLQNQLTRVTDELKKLKMQLASPQTNDRSKDSEKDIPDNTFVSSNLADNSPNQSFSYSIQSVDQQFTSIRTDRCLDETEDKDRQIRILTKKLNASDKQTSELLKEIERLRDMIEHQKG